MRFFHFHDFEKTAVFPEFGLSPQKIPNPEFAYNAALAALRASRMAPPRTQLVPRHKKTGPNGPLHRSGGPFA